MKVLFLDTVHPALESQLSESGYTILKDYNSPRKEILQKFPDVEGIVIRSRFKIDADFLESLSHLKFIARSGAGLENIDLVKAEASGVECFHAPEGNRDAVAEHALGMLLALFNNLIRADQEVRDGKWRREENRGIELMGKTVGLIGFGNMGGAFAQRLIGFGVRVLAYDKYKKDFGNEFVKEVSLKEIQKEADIISLHIPLTEETKYMVNDEFIQAMAKPFFLINTSRGKNIKSEDLVEGLKDGKVVGACLDVLEYESVSFEGIEGEEPTPLTWLKASDRVILSPHVAGWTFESHRKLSTVLAKKIIDRFGANP